MTLLESELGNGQFVSWTHTGQRIIRSLLFVVPVAALVGLAACGGEADEPPLPIREISAEEAEDLGVFIANDPADLPVEEPEPSVASSASEPESQVQLELCDLVPPEEADEALGELVTGVMEQSGDFCLYETSSEVFLRIEHGSPGDFLPGAGMENEAGDLVAAVPIAGVGEEAAWFRASLGGILSFRQGGIHVRIMLYLPDAANAKQLQIAKNLAATVLERIP